MKDKLLLAGALVLMGAGVFLFKHSADQAKLAEDFPDGVWWKCASCQHEFNMSPEEIAQQRQEAPGKSVVCPQCGKRQAVRMYKCPHCGKLFVGPMIEIHGKASCPICKQPMP